MILKFQKLKNINHLLTKGYNVKQLKDICKFYKQKRVEIKANLYFYYIII